jgi:uncharacterized protein (TIGR03067 family)
MAGTMPASAILVEGEDRVDFESFAGHVEDCWDEPEPPERLGRADLEELQGAWVTVSGKREAQLLIAGCLFAVRFKDGELYLGGFDLDPAARPRRMAMHIDEGPARYKGKSARCLYEFDGDFLRWCAAAPGPSEPMMAFPAKDDPRFLSLVFRREINLPERSQ